MDLVERYITAFGKAMKEAYKSNAFAPIKWLTIFLTALIVIAFLLTKNEVMQYILLVLMISIICFALVMYNKILNKDPNLLQTERFRLEEKKLEMIQEKGGKIKFKELDLIEKTKIGGELGE